MSPSARAGRRRLVRRPLVGSSLAAALVSLAAGPVAAQQSLSADLGFGMWRSPTTSTAASVLGLNAARSLPGVQLEGSLAAMRSGDRPGESAIRLGVAHLRAASDTVRVAGLRGALAVGLDRDPYDSTFGRAQLALVPSLAVGGRGLLAWVSVSPTRSFARGATPTGIESEVGAELTRGGIVLSLSALQRRSEQMASIGSDSSGITPSTCRTEPGARTRCLRRGSSTSFEGRASTTLRRVDVAVRGGVVRTLLPTQSTAPAQGWAALRVGAPVRGNVTLVAQVGSEPPNVVRMLPLRSTFSLGLRIRALERDDRRDPPAVARTAPVEIGPPDAAGERALRLFAPGAREVELRGDITGWRCVPLTPADRGQWELRLRVEPGVHYLVVRYDGGPWQTLNGLPQADDGFGEPASVLVVGGAGRS